jgi:hypothetical protein
MALDVQKLATTMFDAAAGVLKVKAPGILSYAKGEFQKIALTIATIESERAAGQITDDQANILLDMQTSASRSVLLTASGLALLDAEAAINAALDAVKPIVNAALGFALL